MSVPKSSSTAKNGNAASIYARLSEVEKHRAEDTIKIESLISTTQTIAIKLDDVATKLAQRSQFSRSDFVSIILVLIAIGGVMVAYVSMATMPFNLRLEEVETQFSANDQLRNVQFSDQQRTNAMMWNALHDIGAKMPTYPTGPFFHPSISRRGPGTAQ